jgi:hypothetical protein
MRTELEGEMTQFIKAEAFGRGGLKGSSQLLCKTAICL